MPLFETTKMTIVHVYDARKVITLVISIFSFESSTTQNVTNKSANISQKSFLLPSSLINL